jgi:hypothetical protein
LVLRRPEDEAISLFAGLLANPDMTLSPWQVQTVKHEALPHAKPDSREIPTFEVVTVQ